MKNTTGIPHTEVENDNSGITNITYENPMKELRWVWRDVPHNIGSKVLQQKWEIVTSRGNIVVDARSEWRDVPEETE